MDLMETKEDKEKEATSLDSIEKCMMHDEVQ